MRALVLACALLSACTFTRRETSYDAAGAPTTVVVNQLSLIHYPPDSSNVQATDASGLHVPTPLGPIVIGAFSVMTAPRDADLEIAGGAKVNASGAITSASRVLRAGQYADMPAVEEKPSLLDRLFKKNVLPTTDPFILYEDTGT
jgi:hypothetical protein